MIRRLDGSVVGLLCVPVHIDVVHDSDPLLRVVNLNPLIGLLHIGVYVCIAIVVKS